MSALASPIPEGLTLQWAAKIMREATKDKTYQQSMLGQEAANYLRIKRKRLTASSHRDYERGLAHFSWYFADKELSDFERPHGTDLVEEFLDHQYGGSSPRNYNKNLSILGSFFEFLVIRGRMTTDPTMPIERAKPTQVYRTTFNEDQCRAIIASADELRDRLVLRLILHYGLRKASWRAVQFKHFDHQRRRLTIFAKGRKVRALPIPDPAFWLDLERLILDVSAEPGHYLQPGRRQIPYGPPDAQGRRATRRVLFPDRIMGDHGAHDWWYERLEDAGIVAKGQRSGERMHKGRHTAGQRILDRTGNLKAAQKLLGHSSIATTGDVYADWDIDQLAATLTDVLGEDTP